MVVASQLRVGAVVRYEGHDYKVIGTEYRPGQGRMSGAMHARLRNLDTGTIFEHAFRSELKLEEMALDKHTLEFLFEAETPPLLRQNFRRPGVAGEGYDALISVQSRSRRRCAKGGRVRGHSPRWKISGGG